jgi:hypothetical protein
LKRHGTRRRGEHAPDVAGGTYNRQAVDAAIDTAVDPLAAGLRTASRYTREDTIMSDFVYLFRIGDAEQRAAMGTPERAQQSMQVWLAWMQELETKGHLKDRGQPLDRTGKVVRGNDKLVTDGPYAETKDLVAGFIVIKARDLEEAAALSAGCPILQGGGSVEIRPVLASPM